jgi:phage tail sheath gpL-like
MAGATSNPNMTIQLTPALIVTAFADRRDLITGQLGAVATGVSGALNIDVHLLTTAQVKIKFGATSELTYRVLAWQFGNDGYSPLDVIGVDEAGGATAATSEYVVTGTATEDGTITVSAVDEKQFSIDVSISSGDINTVISAAINTALGTLTDPPFTNAVVTDTVTLTAVDKGTGANSYGLKVSGNVGGVSIALTGWTGGATSPTLTTILDPIAGQRYTGLSWPEAWFSDIDIPVDEFDSRFNVSNDILDGVVFTGHTDTFANNTSAVAPLNSQSLVVAGNNTIVETAQDGPAILIPADWAQAYFMGVRSKRLTPGAPVADDIISTSGPLDAFGGPHNASLPYFNTPMANVPVTAPTFLFSQLEQGFLEADGFSTFGVNTAGNTMISGVTVTTWTTDAAGNPNDSFHFLNFVDTGSVCREIFFRNLKATYAQSRLTEGDLIPGHSIANAESIKAELLRIYRILSNQALTQAGAEAESFFARNTTVTVDLAARLATIAGPLPIVTQLGVINYTLQFAFTTGQ